MSELQYTERRLGPDEIMVEATDWLRYDDGSDIQVRDYRGHPSGDFIYGTVFRRTPIEAPKKDERICFACGGSPLYDGKVRCSCADFNPSTQTTRKDGEGEVSGGDISETDTRRLNWLEKNEVETAGHGYREFPHVIITLENVYYGSTYREAIDKAMKGKK